METTKICTCCGRELPATEFGTINVRGKIHDLTVCKECMSKKQREGHAKRKEKKDKELAQSIVNARTARLSEFTPRELMHHLKTLGYTGTLTYTRTETINIDDM